MRTPAGLIQVDCYQGCGPHPYCLTCRTTLCRHTFTLWSQVGDVRSAVASLPTAIRRHVAYVPRPGLPTPGNLPAPPLAGGPDDRPDRREESHERPDLPAAPAKRRGPDDRRALTSLEFGAGLRPPDLESQGPAPPAGARGGAAVSGGGVSRDRCVEKRPSRLAHTQEIAGSSPAPATTPDDELPGLLLLVASVVSLVLLACGAVRVTVWGWGF